MDKNVYEFIAAQTGEKIVERKTCQCWEEFAITDKDMEFYEKISPVFGSTKYQIPAPTLCPDCRNRRRMSWKNERKLYRAKSDFSGKIMISMYPNEKWYKVYKEDEWKSDKRSPMDYGRDFDFTRPFFVQFKELFDNVPVLALDTTAWENSEYTNQCWYIKDCYLSFEVWFCEKCYYSNYMRNSTNCMDMLNCNNDQECYQCVECFNSYKLKYSTKCDNCSNSYVLFNCKWCSDCFGCVWLENKQYCFFNQQLSKDEYFQSISEINLGKYWGINDAIKKFDILKKSIPIKNLNILSGENCTWNTIENSNNVFCSFDIRESENIRHCYGIYLAKDCFDHTWWWNNAEKVLECWAIWNNVYNILLSSQITESSDLIYCFNSRHGIKNCFGCIWLHSNEQYCILNKQYTKEEYEELVPKIIEHMKSIWERWEFFPVSISPFGYNESVANEYFPLDRESALDKWFKRQDKEYPINVPEWTETVKAQDLSDNIDDVDDEILKKAVICEISGKPFRIVKPELEFYRKHNLPLPRKHPDVRHLERLSQRAPRKLYLRTCDNCGKQVISVYPADSEFKVYCEECYNKEIY